MSFMSIISKLRLILKIAIILQKTGAFRVKELEKIDTAVDAIEDVVKEQGKEESK